MSIASTPGRPSWSAPTVFELLTHSRTRSTPTDRQVAAGSARPRLLLFRCPPVGVTLAVTLGALLSLAPGLLPRSAAAQAVLTSVLALALLAIAGIARRAAGWGRRRETPGTIAPAQPPPAQHGTATTGRTRRAVAVHAGDRGPGRQTPYRGSGSYAPGTRRGSAPVANPPCPAPPAAGATNALGTHSVDRPDTGSRPTRRRFRTEIAFRPQRVGAGSRAGAPGRVAHRVVSGPAEQSGVLRQVVLAVAIAAVMVAAVHAAEWQNTVRDAMGVARTGPEYWPLWAAGSVVLTVTLVAAGSGIGRVLRRIGWSRGLVMAVVAGLPVALLGGPGIAGASGQNADPNLVQPAAVTRSGSAESLVSWSSLGREGQRFVTDGPPGAVRVYVGLRSAPDPAARAALAVRELDRTGGFDRSHLVVAVPTGSGWVDARALRGFGERFGGDVAVVALQYSDLPSWATFILGRGSAAASARALFTAIEDHTATLPDPPRLHLYGQSLGALGGSAVFAGAAEQNRRVCSVLWAGRPGGGGAEPGARTAVLANTSDPVVHWSLDLLWRPPDLTGTRRDAPSPGWVPVASFVQTTADLLGALGAPPGHGHRYGTDQGTAMPGCG